MRPVGVLVAFAFLALSLFLQGGEARAVGLDIEWCAEDPVVVVFGAQVKVVTSVHAQPSAVSSIAYVIEVPSNAAGRTNVNRPNNALNGLTTVQVSYTGAAWNGSGPLTVSGTLTVTATSAADVLVSVSGPAAASTTSAGTTNAAVSFSTSVTPNGGASAVNGANGQ